jgi:hypothetical protein
VLAKSLIVYLRKELDMGIDPSNRAAYAIALGQRGGVNA